MFNAGFIPAFFLNSNFKIIDMPIRMVDDPNDQGGYNENNDSGGRRGGGGGILSLLPLLFGLIRNPKIFLIVIVVGAFLYFKGGCNQLSQVAGLATGGFLDPKQFEKAEVYEGLDESKNNLPEYVSLEKFAPNRLNQGQQGSCVAWSAAYAARTILEAASTNQDPNQLAFSPAFMYNQIGLDNCQGSYIIRAMKNLTEVGAVPYNDFPYDEKDCTRQPGRQMLADAEEFKMLGFNRLTEDGGIRNISIRSIKEHLASDAPVVIGMMVGGSFMQDMMGQDVWHPTSSDYSQMGFGGHAMCVIGYDDRKEGGAFQIMNSWGNEWGVNGIAWVRYPDFKQFVREAYGLNSLPLKADVANQSLDVSLGLVNSNTKNYIPLRNNYGNLFKTSTPIEIGTQFKMEVKNNSACYVYIFGQETDASSYVLFPYPIAGENNKTKFSPYCGITGYRLFPKGMNMIADSLGNKDFMAVVVSKKALNVFEVNQKINQYKNQNYQFAVNQAFNNNINKNVQYSNTSEGNIRFISSNSSESVVVCIIEIDKK